MSGRVKLLLTSVGSRVGQHILDVLEYPGVSRRSWYRSSGRTACPTRHATSVATAAIWFR